MPPEARHQLNSCRSLQGRSFGYDFDGGIIAPACLSAESSRPHLAAAPRSSSATPVTGMLILLVIAHAGESHAGAPKSFVVRSSRASGLGDGAGLRLGWLYCILGLARSGGSHRSPRRILQISGCLILHSQLQIGQIVLMSHHTGST